VRRSSQAISFQDIANNIGKGVGFANQLLGESGEVKTSSIII
jgi:hypothetical protein